MNVELLLKARVDGKDFTVDVDQDVAPESVGTFVENHCNSLKKQITDFVAEEEGNGNDAEESDGLDAGGRPDLDEDGGEEKGGAGAKKDPATT